MIARQSGWLAAIAATFAGCSPAPTTPPVATESASRSPMPSPVPSSPAVDLTGRWIGVEGMFLDIQRGTAPTAYRLTMQYDLDHKASVDAIRDGDTLTFERDGKRLTLRPTGGDATGLKYLAGKRDCLTVAAGEGYCRD